MATADTQVGTVAHAVLEHRLQGKTRGDATKAALEKTPLTGEEQDMLRTLEDRIDSFLTRFDAFCKSQGVREVLVEVEWGLTAEGHPASFWDKDVFFRGKMDLGVITRDNDLVILDHKSGVARDLRRDVKKQEQLQAYAVLGVANVKDVSGVRGGIHYLQGDDAKAIQWVDYVDATRVRDTYAPWLYGRVNDVASSLKEPYAPRPGLRWPCEWCSYQALCPGFRELTGG